MSEKFQATDLKITGYYGFEGMMDPENNSINYAIKSKQGFKGIIIDTYGVCSNEHKDGFTSEIDC